MWWKSARDKSVELPHLRGASAVDLECVGSLLLGLRFL